MSRSKSYQAVKTKLQTSSLPLDQAIDFLKQNARAKFDETVEVHVRLGINFEKSDQMVRGSVSLPAGSPKQKKVAVFASKPADQAAARQAGAQLVGGEDLVKQVEQAGALDADVAIATPDMMPKIAKVAKILGPKGLMPNPKTGTVTADPVATIKELAGGKISFKMDKTGNIHEAVGKLSWPAEKIKTNTEALLEAIRAAKPKTVKGQLISRITLKSTMSAGITLTS